MIEGIDVAHVLFSDLLAAAPMRENPTMRLCCKIACLYTRAIGGKTYRPHNTAAQRSGRSP
jgi:hypothetical protein